MPVLYKIVEQVKDVITSNGIDIREIYITGLAAAINNIDLYFQENFPDKKCEILTPFFIKKTNVKLNIKDYIEVNSAISLALQGVGIWQKDINFKYRGKLDKLSQLLTIDIGGASKKPTKNNNSSNTKMQNFGDKIKSIFNSDFSKPLDNVEKYMIRFGATLLILLINIFANALYTINKINKKETELQAFITDTQTKIGEISSNSKLINQRSEQYNTFVEKIDEANKELTASYARKKAIPNFLTQIMSNIPKEVQLLSISNSTGKTIKIEAQSKEYEQLGYFIAKIKNEAILTDVTSTSGVKQDEFIKVTIEGNLPY